MHPKLKNVWLFLAFVVACPGFGLAQDFGTTGLTSYSVAPIDFGPYSQTVTWEPVPATPYRYLTGGPVDGISFNAGVHLPQGASVELIEVDGCDTSASGQFVGIFSTAASPAGFGFPAASARTEDPDTPGCVTVQSAVTPPVTIDNQHNLYFVAAVNTSFDGTTYVSAIRLYYRLQVSPAPAVATFNDVPSSDPAFQFIEAFTASGITAGCGGGNYCPDATVTRRQMAVFFAKALGLYWPN